MASGSAAAHQARSQAASLVGRDQMELLLRADVAEPVADAATRPAPLPPTTIVLRPLTRRPLFTAAIRQFASTSCHPLRVETGDRTEAPDVVVLDGLTVAVDSAETWGGCEGVPLLVLGGAVAPAGSAARPVAAWLSDEVDASTFCRTVLDVSKGIVLPVPAVEQHGLSPRECEVLRLIADGLTNEEIADQVCLSINTVKTYVRTAYRKIWRDLTGPGSPVDAGTGGARVGRCPFAAGALRGAQRVLALQRPSS